jgi:signal recognition particle receptor subunit beta
LEFNKRDLQDIAPANYLEYLLNNRKRRVQSFESMAKTGENVFAALDAVTQLLLRKFDSEHRKLRPSPRG